jgi:hypothetical protein
MTNEITKERTKEIRLRLRLRLLLLFRRGHGVVHSMNTRVVRVHGYSPAELLSVIYHHEFTVGTTKPPRIFRTDTNQTWNRREDAGFLEPQQEVHLASRDESVEDVRQRYLTRFVQQQRRQRRYPPGREGYLILLRQAALDNRYDKKLEARWEGPFRLGDLAHHGRSGRIYDLTTGRLVKTKPSGLKDRIHLDDLRVYVSRGSCQGKEVMGGACATAVSVVECARVCWKGDRADEWNWIVSGGAVDFGGLMGSGVFLCGKVWREGPRLRKNEGR